MNVIEQICEGAIEVMVVEGDHKSFISNHVEKIGSMIDNHFYYFAFA